MKNIIRVMPIIGLMLLQPCKGGAQVETQAAEFRHTIGSLSTVSLKIASVMKIEAINSPIYFISDFIVENEFRVPTIQRGHAVLGLETGLLKGQDVYAGLLTGMTANSTFALGGKAELKKALAVFGLVSVDRGRMREGRAEMELCMLNKISMRARAMTSELPTYTIQYYLRAEYISLGFGLSSDFKMQVSPVFDLSLMF